MLIEKEIIAPGIYWYTDEATGLPRKLDVTPELTRYWAEQGNKMLSAGLTVPVPYEHDFSAHPMTPKDKLLNNSGWTNEYRVKDAPDPATGQMRKDVLFGLLDIQDEQVASKLPKTIRWTSPWINSFTDGNGNAWNNVISHVALTLRPRITRQAPFSSIAAALSLATPVVIPPSQPYPSREGFCLSRAGRLLTRRRDGLHRPKYPMAFSIMSGVALGPDDITPQPVAKKKPPAAATGKGRAQPAAEPAVSDDDFEDEADGGAEGVAPTSGAPSTPAAPADNMIDLEPYGDPKGDVSMEELLCDLLSALNIHCEKNADPAQFKRSLYSAAMTKIHELTAKGDAADRKPPEPAPAMPSQNDPNKPKPKLGQSGQPNPLIQQEQQPMYMSLEEIQKLAEPLRSVALSMYNEMAKANAKAEAAEKTLNSLRDAKLRDANAARMQRVALLGKVSPRVKADLDAMLVAPSMALSMGDGGAIIDPMASTLAMLEKGLADIPRMLTAPAISLSEVAHPTDGEMTAEMEDSLANDMARRMGCPPRRAG